MYLFLNTNKRYIVIRNKETININQGNLMKRALTTTILTSFILFLFTNSFADYMDITIKDGEATAYVGMTIDARPYRGIFRLLNRDGQWLILEWEWL